MNFILNEYHIFMIQVLAASEPYNSRIEKVFLEESEYQFCSTRLKPNDILHIVNRYLASLPKVKEYALSLFDPESRELKAEIYRQDEYFLYKRKVLSQKAFYILKPKVRKKYMKGSAAKKYTFKTVEKEEEIDEIKEQMFASAFETLPPTTKEYYFQTFSDYKTSDTSNKAMKYSAFHGLPRLTREGHYAKVGINREEEEKYREFTLFFMYDLALENTQNKPIALEKFSLQGFEKDVKNLKEESEERDSLAIGAYKEIEINNQERPYNEAEYLGLQEMGVDRLNNFQPMYYYEEGLKNLALLREEQKLIAKMTPENLFTERYCKMRTHITEKAYEVRELIDKLQEYFFMDIDLCCSAFFVPLCMSIELIETLNKIVPSLSEKKISSLPELDRKMCVAFEDLKMFLFDTAYSFFGRFPRIGDFNENNLVLSYNIGIRHLSLGRSIRATLFVKVDGKKWISPIDDVYFVCCCITAVKIEKELHILVSTWDNLGNRQQKVHKDSQIIYKVMGMKFDSRALEYPDLLKLDYQIDSGENINFKEDQRKVFVGEHEKGDDSLKKNLENRFDGYKNFLKEQCEKYERESLK